MSTDPYDAVQQEIQTSLQAATQLRASYIRIRNMKREGGDEGEELVWARNEFKATLAALEADLEDLEESVKIVESTDPRMFALTHDEVTERRRYVEHVRKEIQSMRADVSGGRPASVVTPQQREDEVEDDQSAWAREEQQMMIREQDRTIDSIAGTLTNLAHQAGLMGQEIVEHTELLTDLESGVDRTDSKLGNAMSRMRRFIRQSEERGSGWCILVLILVLCILLVVVILI
ncbi:syntaxin 6, N-terminal-domain-containing protein [Desarmillaria tabescens]|uniref:Syntaxin 6, N-terminal-domain-containing protein n=1 Tax=Armillaria tabescens TaxID=1929756 RepID=A0AA39MSP4_ARMTA|nr:syntaxin 6, N-terminal-domain-containing protein [Desarmillaria tabescens]KAK0444604.1 syntaxin 6, N-terminal-domain-containing protein [Desarmillaria tabescens]